MACLASLALGPAIVAMPGVEAVPPPPDLLPPGVIYTNYQVKTAPWSIHVVQWPWTNAQLVLHSTHAGQAAIGLTTLRAQIRLLDPALGTPIAGVNGDFYQRERAYAGDPRGLQIVNGELISAPDGGASFWIDPSGRPQCGNVAPLLAVRWPDGSTSPIGLNEEGRTTNVVLYTPAIGPSTQAGRGRELILNRLGESPWLPLRPGVTCTARVKETHDKGETPLGPGTMVLSIGPGVTPPPPRVEPGAALRITVGSTPDLSGVRTAIGGGPVLLRNGRAQRFDASDSESYQFSSMLERHPRTALGWNRTTAFLVVADGRQKSVSVGMTLKELATFLARLGCQEALNLDGGGSATLWCAGDVRNRPCDGYERVIANSLILVHQAPEAHYPPAAGSPSPTQ